MTFFKTQNVKYFTSESCWSKLKKKIVRLLLKSLLYLYLIIDDFVKFLHVGSIQTMKAEGFQFETQHT